MAIGAGDPGRSNELDLDVSLDRRDKEGNGYGGNRDTVSGFDCSDSRRDDIRDETDVCEDIEPCDVVEWREDVDCTDEVDVVADDIDDDRAGFGVGTSGQDPSDETRSLVYDWARLAPSVEIEAICAVSLLMLWFRIFAWPLAGSGSIGSTARRLFSGRWTSFRLLSSEERFSEAESGRTEACTCEPRLHVDSALITASILPGVGVILESGKAPSALVPLGIALTGCCCDKNVLLEVEAFFAGTDRLVRHFTFAAGRRLQVYWLRRGARGGCDSVLNGPCIRRIGTLRIMLWPVIL